MRDCSVRWAADEYTAVSGFHTRLLPFLTLQMVEEAIKGGKSGEEWQRTELTGHNAKWLWVSNNGGEQCMPTIADTEHEESELAV